MSDVKKIATRDSYGNALAELGTAHENVVVLDADLAAATKTGKAPNDEEYAVAMADLEKVGEALCQM